MKYLKKLTKSIIILILIICVNENTFSQSKASYHIKNGVQLNKTYCNDLTKLIVMLPFAQTNQYQSVSNINYYDGELLNIPETDDKYLRFTLLQTDIQNQSNIFNVFYEFDIILNSINFDFNQITQIYPYNTSSNNYIWYTGSSGEFVVPTNSTIQTVGNNIWSQSSDIVDYAERCYEYVATNYDYLNPNTGLHPLSEILSAGGGDCGNLSSIYISLLRYKNIPSRHVVTIRPDGYYHVWADFYLENYGWIPVDVTYKQGNPSGDYFGKYDGNGIVVTKEVWLYLQRDVSYSYYADLLQNYHWWYWYGGGGCNSLTSNHYVISSEPTYVETTTENQISIYPNPSNEYIKIKWTTPIDNSVVEIYSITGSLLYKNTLNSDNSINISDLKSGIYIIKMNSGSFSLVEKFIKE